eukprot:tig00020723_g13468.t1
MGCCRSRPTPPELGLRRDGHVAISSRSVKEVVVQFDACEPPKPAQQNSLKPQITIEPPTSTQRTGGSSAVATQASTRSPSATPSALGQLEGSIRSKSGAVAAASRGRPGRETRAHVARVFLSSTFQDMQAERDAIRALASPKLRALCDARGVFFHAVDLRWGISDESCKEGDVCLLCLREVARSAYFVGIIKGRYGWHHRPDAAPGDEGNALFSLCAALPPPPLHPSLPSPPPPRLHPTTPSPPPPSPASIPPPLSSAPSIHLLLPPSPPPPPPPPPAVTEIEIRAGLLNDPEGARGRALFYYAGRDLLRGAAAGGGEGPAAGARLDALKAEIRASGVPVAEYEGPDELALALRDDLARVQRDRRTKGGKEVRSGGAGDFAALDAYAAGGGPEALVLTGDGGSSKSALVANWAAAWAAGHPEDLTLVHFAGASNDSAQLPPLARRVGEELAARFPGLDERLTKVDPAGSDAEVAYRLTSALAAGASAYPSRVVLVVDGLDQLRGDAAATGLAWLPAAAGPRLRLVLACTPGAALEAARARPHALRVLAPLDGPRRRALVAGGRALSEERLERIVGAAPCRNALFLTVLLEELSSTSIHANLDADIAALVACPGPQALFGQLLRRLGARHGAALLRDILAALVSSRHGMAEGELADFLDAGAGGPSQVAFSQLWYGIVSLLVCRDGLYTFFHRCAAEAAEAECGLAAGGEARRAFHERLGDYFLRQPESRRRSEEGSWALARAGPAAGERLAGLLAEPATLFHLDAHELARLWEASGRADQAADRYMAALQAGADPGHLPLVSRLLFAMGREEDARAFNKGAVQHQNWALTFFERVAGADHPDTAQARSSSLLCSPSALHEDALRIRRKVLGPDHLDTAASLHNMGVVSRGLGDAAAAKPFFEEALRVRGEALGRAHPTTAETLYQLASVHLQLRELEAARALFEEAVPALSRALGPDEPPVARAAKSLAACLAGLGRTPEAVPHLQVEQALAFAYKSTGDAAGQLALLREAAEARRAGAPGAPETARAVEALAAFLDERGAEAAALPLYQESLAIRQAALGPDHPDVAGSLFNISAIYINRGAFVAARPLLEEAHRIRSASLGESHPSTAHAAQNLAIALVELREHAAARPLLQAALRARVAAHGPRHPATIATMQNCGTAYLEMGDAPAAQEMFRAALEAAEAVHGAGSEEAAQARAQLQQALALP